MIGVEPSDTATWPQLATFCNFECGRFMCFFDKLKNLYACILYYIYISLYSSSYTDAHGHLYYYLNIPLKVGVTDIIGIFLRL